MTDTLPAAQTRAPKPPMLAGGAVAALVPQSMEEAFRVAQAIAASGLAPRGLDKPEQVLVAIMAGAELGFAPFQALQSFAVVNGRPTLWGDGLVALVRANGVRVSESIAGEDDKMVATCTATRPDTGEEITRTFSVADAKKAGLWGKQGPWQTNPKRMLQMRARAFALRDGCADMLKGMQMREEVEDYQPIRDVTPQRTGLAARLSHAAAPSSISDAVETALADEEPHDPVTGEVGADETDNEAAQPDDDDSFPGDGPAPTEADFFPGDR